MKANCSAVVSVNADEIGIANPSTVLHREPGRVGSLVCPVCGEKNSWTQQACVECGAVQDRRVCGKHPGMTNPKDGICCFCRMEDAERGKPVPVEKVMGSLYPKEKEIIIKERNRNIRKTFAIWIFASIFVSVVRFMFFRNTFTYGSVFTSLFINIVLAGIGGYLFHNRKARLSMHEWIKINYYGEK